MKSFKSKVSKWKHRHDAQEPSSSAPSPQVSRTSSPQITPQATSESSAPPPAAVDSKSPSVPTLQEKLWNQAYESLKTNDEHLVKAYEKILSAQLNGEGSNGDQENAIGATQDTRSEQMRKLVGSGLERSRKKDAVWQGVGQGLQAVQEVRRLVDGAIQAAPQAAVAWVGVCLGLEIIANPVSEASGHREGISYVLSRMEWYWNLVPLLLQENRSDSSTAALQGHLEEAIVDLYEKLLSYQAGSVCRSRRNQLASIGRDLLKLDDWAGQLEAVKKAEEAVKEIMDQCNTEESKSHLRTLAQAADKTMTSLQGIQSAIEKQTQRQEERYKDDKDEQCLKDLYLADPRNEKKRIERTKGGLLKGSYRWILDNKQFKDWKDARDGQGQLLWIRGDPGKGKTMLLCGIIDELEKEHPKFPMPYFFCQDTDQRLNNATAVLRGLIYHLVCQRRTLISHLRPQYDRTGASLFTDESAWEALSSILVSMLGDAQSDGAILVIDGLDECRTGRDMLLDFITTCHPSCVKWVISSRNWVDIEQRLGSAANGVALHLELNQDAVSEATEIYIEHKVKELAALKRYDAKTADAVKQHLVANAGGTFLWVALVCQELRSDKVTRNSQAIKKLQLFPPGLGPLYRRMLEQIFESADSDICRELLAIASVAYQPVSLDELKLLMDSLGEDEYDELPEIVASCGSFLSVDGDIVFFVHQSAKDYLLKRGPEQGSEKALVENIPQQHYAMFEKSLQGLSDTLVRDVCQLGAPGYLTDDVSPSQLQPLSSIRYSCLYWIDHLSDADPTEMHRALQDSGTVMKFIESKFLYWLEALSLLRSMPQEVKAVRKLGSLATSAGARQLVNLVQDAHRFLNHTRPSIEGAPLQAYASALLFSPKLSLIRNLFRKEEPDWMLLKPQMEANWNACLQTFEGDGEPILQVAWSPDGQRLASVSWCQSVKIWDTVTGVCQKELGADGTISSVAWSLDGRRLATGSSDATLRIWDPESGACQLTCTLDEGNGTNMASLAWSPDGRHLASGSEGTARILDAATGECRQTLGCYAGEVSSVAWSPDSKYLAAASADSTIYVFDAQTGERRHMLNGHKIQLYSVVWSPDGRRLASGSLDKTLVLWDAEAGVAQLTLTGHGEGVSALDWSPDSRRLASASYDKTVKIWDAETGACRQTLKGHRNGVKSVSWSPDGHLLASGSFDFSVKIWDGTAGNASDETVEGHDDGAVVLAGWSPDGQRLMSRSASTIKIWEAISGTCQRVIPKGDWDWGGPVAWSPDGQVLAVACSRGPVQIWDATAGDTWRHAPDGHHDRITAIAWSPDSRYLASGAHDKTVRIWEVAASGACQQTLDQGKYATALAWSPDGQRLASGSWNGIVKIWHLASGACQQTLAHASSERDMSKRKPVFLGWSSDGRRLASGSTTNGLLSIWDVESGTCQQTLEVDWDPVDPSVSALEAAAGVCFSEGETQQVTDRAVVHATTRGYYTRSRGAWLCKDGRGVLWVPPDYRPAGFPRSGYVTPVHGGHVAFGCKTGHVLRMRFA